MLTSLLSSRRIVLATLALIAVTGITELAWGDAKQRVNAIEILTVFLGGGAAWAYGEFYSRHTAPLNTTVTLPNGVRWPAITFPYRQRRLRAFVAILGCIALGIGFDALGPGAVTRHGAIDRTALGLIALVIALVAAVQLPVAIGPTALSIGRFGLVVRWYRSATFVSWDHLTNIDVYGGSRVAQLVLELEPSDAVQRTGSSRITWPRFLRRWDDSIPLYGLGIPFVAVTLFARYFLERSDERDDLGRVPIEELFDRVGYRPEASKA